MQASTSDVCRTLSVVCPAGIQSARLSPVPTTRVDCSETINVEGPPRGSISSQSVTHAVHADDAVVCLQAVPLALAPLVC